MRQNTSGSGIHQEAGTIDARIIKDLIRRSGPSQRFYHDTSGRASLEDPFRDRLDSAAPLHRPPEVVDRVIIVEERPQSSEGDAKSPTLQIPRPLSESRSPPRITHAHEKPALQRHHSPDTHSPYHSAKGREVVDRFRRGRRGGRSRSDRSEDPHSPLNVLSQSADDHGNEARMRNTISHLRNLRNTQFLSGGTN